jgi:hypothetical protein
MLNHVCSMALNSKYDCIAVLHLGQRKRHWWELGCLSTKPWWCMVERVNIPRIKFYVGWRREGQKSNLHYDRFTHKKKTFLHTFLPPVLYDKTRYLTDRIIFHVPFLVATCYAFYCCKIHPFVVHHIKIDISGFLITGYSDPPWVGVQVFTSS